MKLYRLGMLLIASQLLASAAFAQANEFWNSYYAAQTGYNNTYSQSVAGEQLATQREMLQAYRQANGLPQPSCRTGLLGILFGLTPNDC